MRSSAARSAAQQIIAIELEQIERARRHGIILASEAD
jgi:hypothetical protein